MPWKKILAIIAFIGITIGLGYLLYYIFWRPIVAPPPPPPEVPPPEVRLPIALPGVPTPVEAPPPPVLPVAFPILKPPAPLPPEISEIARGDLTWTATLTERRAQDVTLTPDGQNLQYYDRTEGRFYRITPDGQTTLLSDRVFHNVSQTNWSPDANKTILEFPDGSNVFFDFTTQKQVTLPKHWENFDFSPDSNQIAGLSIGTNPENRWLFISNPDGSNAQIIEPLGNNADKVKVSWSPNNQIIATSRTGEPMGFDRQMVLMIGKHGENFKGLVVEGRGFDYKWSPTGRRMLYNVYSSGSDYKPVIWISGAQGDEIGANRKNLQINTWAEKCAFENENTVYCAVPQTLERGAGLMPSIANNIPDTFYKIDLTTGLRTIIALPDRGLTAKQVTVSADGKYLFFTDQATGRLERLQLK